MGKQITGILERKNIRGLDAELYQKAQIVALKASKPGEKVTVGEVINDAIKFYLEHGLK